MDSASADERRLVNGSMCVVDGHGESCTCQTYMRVMSRRAARLNLDKLYPSVPCFTRHNLRGTQSLCRAIYMESIRLSETGE